MSENKQNIFCFLPVFSIYHVSDLHYRQMNVVAEHGGSWRRLVLERRLQEELEDALPSLLEEALRLARLGGHLVRRLRLRRLLQTAPGPGHAPGHALPLPLTPGWTPDLPHERRELPMMDSELDALEEDLCAILGYFVNLEVCLDSKSSRNNRGAKGSLSQFQSEIQMVL